MKFSKLPKEKRNHLILVGLLTAAAMGGLGFGLIKSQFKHLSGLSEKKEVAEQKLHRMQESIKHAARLQADLIKLREELVEQHSTSQSFTNHDSQT